ncbi:MAG: tRNA (adenosine(37)-N6)-dimethylallyltransferase MiaA [Candidatus Coatesbacteria bacterium]|nr:tRNA (adenosine(37)-N6)-dimethylallyltransferase MiaA [Candidatus Coatesbacteria bacterium]
MTNKSTPFIVISGPTASGKSELALALAEKYNGEIISADSRQNYKLLDIGTAKPSKDELKRVKHHLIDFLDLNEIYSAGRFLKDSRALINSISLSGKVPFIVGGTGFYTKSCLEGLPEIPIIPDEITGNLKKIIKEEGVKNLYNELIEKDPAYAKTIASTDHIRLVRSLSVIRTTGKPYSSYKVGDGERIKRPYFHFLIDPPKEVVKQRIAKRTIQMINSGWVDETRKILEMGYHVDCQGLQTIGYKEIIEYIKGKITIEEAEKKIITITGQYAKRQQTFFSTQFNDGFDLKLWPADISKMIPILDGYLMIEY